MANIGEVSARLEIIDNTTKVLDKFIKKLKELKRTKVDLDVAGGVKKDLEKASKGIERFIKKANEKNKIEFKVDSERLNRGLKNASKNINAVRNSARGLDVVGSTLDKQNASIVRFSKNLNTAGKRLDSIGKKATIAGGAITAATGGILLKSIDIAAGFDKIFAGTAAIARADGVAEKTIDSLKNAIIDFGTKGVFSIEEVALAADDMVKDGLNPALISASQLPAVYSLAAAAGTDLSQAQIALSDTMQAFGAETQDAMRYADVFANFLNATPGELSEFTDAMKEIAPTAASVNVSLEDVSAALGVLGQRGIRGSRAGNALSSVLVNLARPTAEMKRVMKSLNVEVFDSQGRFKGLRSFIEQLSSSTSGLTQEQRSYALAVLGGKTQVAELTQLVNAGVGAFDEMRGGLSAAGTAQKIAEDRTKGLSAAYGRLKNSINGIFVAIGTQLTPVVNKVANIFKKLFDTISKNNGKLAKIVAIFLGVGLAVGALITTLGTLGIALGWIASGFSALLTVAAAVFSPIGIAIAAVTIAMGGLIAAMISLRGEFKVFETVRKLASDTFDSLKTKFEEVKESLRDPAVKKSLDGLKDAFAGAAEALKPIITGLKIILTDIFGPLTGGKTEKDVAGTARNIKNTIDDIRKVIEFLTPVIKVVATAIAVNMVVAFKYLQFQMKAFSVVIKVVVAAFNILKGVIAVAGVAISSLGNVLRFSVSVFGLYINALKLSLSVLKLFVEGVKFAVSSTVAYWAWLVEVIQNVAAWHRNLASQIAEFVNNAISKFVEFVTAVGSIFLEFVSLLQAAFETAKANVVAFVEFVLGFLNTIVQFFVSLPGKIGEAMGGVLATLFEKFEEIRTGITEKFNEILTDAKNFGVNIVNSIVEGIGSIGSKISSTISGLTGNLKSKIGFSGGGMSSQNTIYASGGYKPKGSDIIPAMLTPNERVLSIGQNQGFERIITALSGMANIRRATPGEVNRGINVSIEKVFANNEHLARKSGADISSKARAMFRGLGRSNFNYG